MPRCEGRPLGTRWFVLLLALLPAGAALGALHGRPALLGAALLVVLAPWWCFWRREPLPETAPEARRGGWGALCVLLLVALVLRLAGLERYPARIDLDSGLNAVISASLAGRPYTPLVEQVAPGVESTFFYLMHGCFRLGGYSVFTLRLPAVLLGLVTLLALFLFARELFGRRVALVAVLLATVAPWTMLMHRTPKHSLLVAPLLCLTYVVLLRALREGGWWRWLAAGCLAGASCYTYVGYRHGALAALGFVVLHAVVMRRALVAPLAWIFAGCALATAPLLAQLLRWSEIWWVPLLQNAALLDWRELELARQLARVLHHAWIVLPGVAPGPTSALGLLGAGALPLLLRWRDPRLLLLCWLALTMIAPPAGARYSLEAPRHYVALLPVLFTLQALVLVRLDGRLRGRRRAVGRAWGAALAALLLVDAGFALRGAPVEGRQRVLRVALRLARDGETVYLPAGFAGEEQYALQFFLLHPRVRELPENDPFALDRLPAGGLTLVPDGTELAQALRAGSPEMTLRREGGVSVYRTGKSVPHPERPGKSGWLHLERDGRYTLVAPPGARGPFWLDGEPVLPGAAQATSCELALARGLHRYRTGGAWRPVLQLAGREVRARHWPAALAPGRFAAAPLRFEARGFTLVASHVPPIAGTLTFNRSPQDIAAAGSGLYVAQLDRVRRLEAATGRADPGWRLRDEQGRPLAERYDYEPLHGKRWSVARHPRGLLVASAPGRWVALFDLEGRWLARLLPPAGWRRPIDVAVAEDGRCAVVDAVRGEVRLFDRQLRPGAAIRLARRPLAAAWAGPTLVLLDGASFSLVALPPGDRPRRRFVGRVDDDSRLRPAPGGGLVLCNARRVRRYDRRLRLLAPAGDPAALDSTRHDRANPIAAGFSPDGRMLWVLDLRGTLHGYAPRPLLPHELARWSPGIEVPATAPVAGNVNVEPAGFGPGLAIDGGEPAGYAEYRVPLPHAGRHAVWARYAAGDPRPFAVELAGRVLRCAGGPTGGFQRRDLRWVRLGALELPAGELRLIVRSPGMFPHLERIKLAPEVR